MFRIFKKKEENPVEELLRAQIKFNESFIELEKMTATYGGEDFLKLMDEKIKRDEEETALLRKRLAR
jgi:hypothetical protein